MIVSVFTVVIVDLLLFLCCCCCCWYFFLGSMYALLLVLLLMSIICVLLHICTVHTQCGIYRLCYGCWDVTDFSAAVTVVILLFLWLSVCCVVDIALCRFFPFVNFSYCNYFTLFFFLRCFYGICSHLAYSKCWRVCSHFATFIVRSLCYTFHIKEQSADHTSSHSLCAWALDSLSVSLRLICGNRR